MENVLYFLDDEYYDLKSIITSQALIFAKTTVEMPEISLEEEEDDDEQSFIPVEKGKHYVMPCCSVNSLRICNSSDEHAVIIFCPDELRHATENLILSRKKLDIPNVRVPSIYFAVGVFLLENVQRFDIIQIGKEILEVLIKRTLAMIEATIGCGFLGRESLIRQLDFEEREVALAAYAGYEEVNKWRHQWIPSTALSWLLQEMIDRKLIQGSFL
ncbi:hypothetical protein ACOME3_001438 [Neoechinorhynchus agilis]